jgi:hypothetical protein
LFCFASSNVRQPTKTKRWTKIQNKSLVVPKIRSKEKKSKKEGGVGLNK